VEWISFADAWPPSEVGAEIVVWRNRHEGPSAHLRFRQLTELNEPRWCDSGYGTPFDTESLALNFSHWFRVRGPIEPPDRIPHWKLI
jgi:hypothetical protein